MLSTEKPHVSVVGIDYSELRRLALHQAFEDARERTSQGRTDTSRLLLGSVVHAVVNLAPRPVLVVRDRTFRPRASNAELARAHRHADLASVGVNIPLVLDWN
jgi:hypothetical protein